MFGIVVLHITSLSTNEIGRFLTPKEILQKGSRPHVEWYCCPARWVILLSRTLSDIVVPHVGRWQLSGSLYVFLIVTSYTLTRNWGIARLRERPTAFRASLANMTLAWPGSERSFGWFKFFFTSALIDRKLMAYKLLWFQTVAKYTCRNWF